MILDKLLLYYFLDHFVLVLFGRVNTIVRRV